MSEFNFKSASVKIKERELQLAESVPFGLTSLGLVGETMKGPAFEPVAVASEAEYKRIFGGQSNERFPTYDGKSGKLKYVLPFYANSFLKESNSLYVTRVLGLSGYNAGKAWAITVQSSNTGSTYNNMVVGVLRSRGRYNAQNELEYFASGVSYASGATSGATAQFNLTITGSRPATIACSLNPDSQDFIAKVLGQTPNGKSTGVYVESIFPDLLRKLIANGEIIGINKVQEMTTAASGGYKTKFQTPVTPFVVSQVKGSEVDQLFRLVSISDGDSANKEIKISIENIDIKAKTFDVIIRDFNDTDEAPVVLERFSRLTMDTNSANFVGRRIGGMYLGDSSLEWDLTSKYAFVEIARGVSEDSYPAGFEGYEFKKYVGVSGSTTGITLTSPEMIYKSNYESTDKIGRTYLGISERAFDTVGARGTGINQNLFNFAGQMSSSGLSVTKGFHMDIEAPASKFVLGAGSFKNSEDIEGTGTYADVKSRKFTFVPYGGFDGWDIYSEARTNTDSVANINNETSDFQAYGQAIMTMDNPEETFINLFATPDLDWRDNNTLVKAALEMIQKRADALYIMDSPEYDANVTSVDEVRQHFRDADIDSSYACTQFPHIQVEERESKSLLYIPAGGAVAKQLAFTDRTKAAWWAAAGLQRGIIAEAKKAKIKLKEEHRDALADARINPIAQFRDVGVDIFGQRTTLRGKSAMDRINVRRLLIQAQGIIKKLAMQNLFDPNDDKLVTEFITAVNRVLSTIQRERGITSFSVKVADSPEGNARNRKYFLLSIVPTDALEEIGLIFEVSEEGVKFDV
jgi:hypothetical protein